MVSSQEAIDLNEDELSNAGEAVCEEAIEEYVLEEVYTSSSTHQSFIEDHSHAAVEIIKEKSSSNNISSVIPSFQSSSSLRSTYPPASWPSDSSDDIYLQSASDGVIDLSHIQFDVSSSEPEKEFPHRKKELSSKHVNKTKIPKKKLQTKTKQTKTVEEIKCDDIPLLNEIIEEALQKNPHRKVHYVEKLKVSIDKSKMLSDGNVIPTTKLIIPEKDFAGDFSLNVEETSQGIFIESASSFMDCDSHNGTELFSKLTNELWLIEEKRTEYQYTDSERKEKSLHVFMDKQKYIAYRTNKINELEEKHRGCISMDCQSDLVLDGSLFGIMRHLIAIQYSGCFQCYSMTISGRLCKQVFCIDDKKYLKVNQDVLELIVLRKSTYDYSTGKKIEMSETYFLPTGGMIYHSWKYSPYIVHIDPILLTHERKLNPCLELTWKSDYILSSMFEFEKEYAHCLLQKYLDRYPEVIELLNDYVIALFHKKPNTVVKFTCDFFENV